MFSAPGHRTLYDQPFSCLCGVSMPPIRPFATAVAILAVTAAGCSAQTASQDSSGDASNAPQVAASAEAAASEAAASEAAAQAAASEAAASEAAAQASEAAASEAAASEAARIEAEEEAARIAAEEEAARIAAEEEAARIAAEEEAARIAAEEEAARIAAEKAEKEAKEFQTQLKELGYYSGGIDGDVGSGTIAAIKDFQRVNELQADGVVGPRTKEVLASDGALPKPPPPPPTEASTGGGTSVSLPASGVLSVAAAQQVLRELNYYGGEINGEASSSFRTALTAFQKVEGIGADGALGPTSSDRLRSPRTPSLQGGNNNRIEIDLSLQVIHVVKDGTRIRTMPTSSGNGATYLEKDGDEATALTPVGNFRIERRITGVREADLGTLYDPLYFYRGWAIHGSNSVPSYPASHGCTRVSLSDIKWLANQMPNGTQVRIYGGAHTFSP